MKSFPSLGPGRIQHDGRTELRPEKSQKDLVVKRYAAWPFGLSALFNLSVAAGLLIKSATMEALLRLDPVQGTNIVFLNFAAVVIGLFGYSYARIALDPVKFRSHIQMGALGKLLAEASALVPWLKGEITFLLPALLTFDVILASLFLDYLRRTRVQFDSDA